MIPVDVLVMREGDKLKIRISSITFAADTADYLGVEADKVEKNLRALKRLAEIFEKYRAYNVLIEGHAVNLNWANPAAAEREEKEELAPLSLARAESVKEALVELGMDGRRITTEGLGGRFPVVPHGDLDNRWKNRRVEFVLVPGRAGAVGRRRRPGARCRLRLLYDLQLVAGRQLRERRCRQRLVPVRPPRRCRPAAAGSGGRCASPAPGS